MGRSATAKKKKKTTNNNKWQPTLTVVFLKLVIIIQENIMGSGAYYACMDATSLKISAHIAK